MNKRSPKKFRRHIKMGLRNFDMPDTLWQKASGWRRVLMSKEPLSVFQVVGMLVMLFSLPLAIVGLGLEKFQEAPGGTLTRILVVLGGFVVVFCVFGAGFLLLRWRIWKALASPNKQPPYPK